MRLLGLDFETTGLDTKVERITEIGMALWDSRDKSPSITQNLFVYHSSIEERFTPASIAMMERVSGITPELLREFGATPEWALGYLNAFVTNHKVDFIVAHNGTNFDRPLLESELGRYVPEWREWNLAKTPWIDTRTDIPYSPEDEPQSRRLSHLCLDAGFINPFPHRALFDVVSMLKLLMKYDLDKVVDYSRTPFVTVIADVSYENRELAKAQRYAWEQIGDIKIPKRWIKRVKQNMVAREKELCSFLIIEVPN